MSAQCALDDAGNLLPTSSITFYDSESDDKPLAAIPAAEATDDNGNAPVPRAPRPRTTNTPRTKFIPESPSEEEDTDFSDSDSEIPGLMDVSDSEDEYDSDISDLLASKTVPARGGAASSKPQTRKKASGGTKRKQSSASSDGPAPKSCRATVEEVDDEGDTPKTRSVQNLIYLFYDFVPKNTDGGHGKEGDKHYKCRHGSPKLSPSPRLCELVTHLKNGFLIMYCLFQALYTRKDVPATKGEINLAHGDIPSDGDTAKAYLGKVETATSSILKGLEKKARKAQGNFDQEVFNNLLAEWMVACDQPFEEVEKPEFIRLMEYTHHGSTLNFKVPGRTAETLTTGLAVKYYAGKALEDKSKKTQLHTHTHTHYHSRRLVLNTVGDDNPRLSQPYERPKLSENFPNLTSPENPCDTYLRNV
ncbi:hypothetical protein C8R46DRAFT_1044381 [Mycena filopes]|nr:hypothetical protein C8R46DRAFT_1044381 [Mycena filopes]